MGISRQPSPLQNTIGQKKTGECEIFQLLGSMLTNDARCTHEIKSIILLAALNKKKDLFTRKLDLNLSKKLAKATFRA